MMTSKNKTSAAKKPTMPMTSVAALIEAQVAFTQTWICQHAQPLSIQLWQWLGAQPMRAYMSANDVQCLIHNWLLSQPMSEPLRADIRDILNTIIYHPMNETMPLSKVVADSQIENIATYIGSHEQQRNIWIHTLIGNETFADLLTQTLYHAINDFMESTLDKAGGVGKLMKMGRSSFEKATNRNLDDRLQGYLHRNIKDLAQRAEANAQAHLSNDEVARLIMTGWTRIKSQPISHIQAYLRNDAEHNSIEHLEASVQQSYNRLRVSPYLHGLVAAGVDTWYANHKADTFATLAAGLNINEHAITQLSTALLPMIHDAIDSPWFSAHLTQMLQAFFAQDNIKNSLIFNQT